MKTIKIEPNENGKYEAVRLKAGDAAISTSAMHDLGIKTKNKIVYYANHYQQIKEVHLDGVDDTKYITYKWEYKTK